MKQILSFILTFFIFTSCVIAKDFRIIQISETKFSKNDDNQIEKLIKDINKEKNVDLVVFTGDNISKPNKDDLKEFLLQLKKLKYPYYVVIGDKEVNKLKDLSKLDYIEILQKNIKKYKYTTPNYSFLVNDLAFLVVDGAKDVIPSSNGYFKAETLEWLENEIKLYPNNNIIILQHFPLIPPSNKETYVTLKPEKYLEIVAKNKNIKAIISGHFNENKETELNGVMHISSPSYPNYKVIDIMDYETKNPVFWSVIKKI